MFASVHLVSFNGGCVCGCKAMDVHDHGDLTTKFLPECTCLNCLLGLQKQVEKRLTDVILNR